MSIDGFDRQSGGIRDVQMLKKIWRLTPDWVKWLALSPIGARFGVAFVFLCWLRSAGELALGDLSLGGTWLSAAIWAALAYGAARVLVMVCRIDRRLRTYGLGHASPR